MVRALYKIVGSTFLLLLISFALLRVLPGGAFDEERQIPQEVRLAWEQQYGLHQNVLQQSILYFSRFFQGHLGYSSVNPEESVSEVIRSRVQTTFLLAFWAGVLAFVFALILFLLPFKKFTFMLARFFITLPMIVWLGVVLLLSSSLGFSRVFDYELSSYMICMMALAIPMAWRMHFLSAKTYNEEMNKMYVGFHRSMGFQENKIARLWVFKNSAIPWVLYWIQGIAGMFTGVVILESMYGIPGLGKLFVERLLVRDMNVVIVTLLIFALVIVVFQWLSELMMRLLDPRVQKS